MIIILESPNKARKVSSFLKGATILASFGHIKDLPSNQFGIKKKGNSYHGSFIPLAKQKQKIAAIINTVKNKKNDKIIIATDPDREGYAIANHLFQELSKITDENNIYRAEFREITPAHIQQQLRSAVPFRNTNHNLYKAFLGRRITDRLVGYVLSPEACAKIGGKFSVGRVQSPTVKLVVDREKEIQTFKPVPYYIVSVETEKDGVIFTVSSKKYDKKEDADRLVQTLRSTKKLKVDNIKIQEKIQNPPAPFTTSTLQQTANRALRFSTSKTMQIAQRLFEEGYITYHRTDSTRLSDEFLSTARQYIANEYGKHYWLNTPRQYVSKNSQADAHEAIRPTHVDPLQQTMQKMRKDGLSDEHIKLYTMIFQRAVASQMAGHRYKQTTVICTVNNDTKNPLTATGKTPVFEGYRKVYKINENDKEKETEQSQETLPVLNQGDILIVNKAVNNEKHTQPPSRYTEGSLVKTLEKLGIGRPSTYASILSSIKSRQYITTQKSKLIPTKKAFEIISFLEKFYPWIIDYQFTSEMESYLDKVEEGKANVNKFIKNIHEKMNYLMPDQIQKQKVVSEKMKAFAIRIAKEKGVNIDNIIDDYDKLKAFLDKNVNRQPSPKAIKFAESLAQKRGIQVPKSAYEDYKKLSAFINKMKSNNNTRTNRRGYARNSTHYEIRHPSQ